MADLEAFIETQERRVAEMQSRIDRRNVERYGPARQVDLDKIAIIRGEIKRLRDAERDALRERLAAAEAELDIARDSYRVVQAERDALAVVIEAAWDVIALRHGSIPMLKKRLQALDALAPTETPGE